MLKVNSLSCNLEGLGTRRFGDYVFPNGISELSSNEAPLFYSLYLRPGSMTKGAISINDSCLYENGLFVKEILALDVALNFGLTFTALFFFSTFEEKKIFSDRLSCDLERFCSLLEKSGLTEGEKLSKTLDYLCSSGTAYFLFDFSVFSNFIRYELVCNSCLTRDSVFIFLMPEKTFNGKNNLIKKEVLFYLFQRPLNILAYFCTFLYSIFFLYGIKLADGNLLVFFVLALTSCCYLVLDILLLNKQREDTESNKMCRRVPQGIFFLEAFFHSFFVFLSYMVFCFGSQSFATGKFLVVFYLSFFFSFFLSSLLLFPRLATSK